MMYTVRQAKARLSELIEEACEGKEVLITRGNKPVAKLVAIGGAKKKRVPGRLERSISYSPDAFEALDERERKVLGFE